MYNPKSLKAEEFIDHQEILDTLAYADENKENVELIDQILNKARERKGLSHREASVLLVCEEEDLRDLLQFLHFRRVAAPLLDVAEIGCGHMEHFGHFSERYLLFLPFPL